MAADRYRNRNFRRVDTVVPKETLIAFKQTLAALEMTQTEGIEEAMELFIDYHKDLQNSPLGQGQDTYLALFLKRLLAGERPTKHLIARAAREMGVRETQLERFVTSLLGEEGHPDIVE